MNPQEVKAETQVENPVVVHEQAEIAETFEFLEKYESSVDASGSLDLEAADALARTRHKVLDILPLTRHLLRQRIASGEALPGWDAEACEALVKAINKSFT